MTGQVDELMTAIVAAEQNGDAAVYEDILADDFFAVGPLGFVLSREQWLGRFRDGRYKCARYHLSELSTAEYEAAALVLARVDMDATYDGQPTPAPHTRAVHVFARQDGRWVLACVQHSSITRPS